jgi:hypothetical protein
MRQWYAISPGRERDIVQLIERVEKRLSIIKI